MADYRVTTEDLAAAIAAVDMIDWGIDWEIWRNGKLKLDNATRELSGFCDALLTGDMEEAYACAVHVGDDSWPAEYGDGAGVPDGWETEEFLSSLHEVMRTLGAVIDGLNRAMVHLRAIGNAPAETDAAQTRNV